MAFDHGAIVLAGRERLRAKLSYTNVGFALAPESFTISELRELYAAALGHDGLGDEPAAGAAAARAARSDRRAPRPRARRAAGPRELFRFRSRRLEVTDQFAVLRPPRPQP